MMAALGLLFVALLVVTGRNWDFWSQYLFPQTAETDTPAGDGVSTKTQAVTASNKASTVTITRKPRSAPKAPPIVPEANQQTPAVTTQRTVLPPLEIEVVSGGQHSKLQPKTNALHVELDSGSQAQPSAAQSSGAITQAAQRVPITSGDQVVSHEVEPSYPYLAKQQKVQGSVLLRALVSKSGDIQDLQVLKGPTMLAEAARDAVKQWRFKPYYQDGQPVETEAQIRVNFTISAY
jgi:protein TonB